MTTAAIQIATSSTFAMLLLLLLLLLGSCFATAGCAL
jgi:hypothetical protein